MFKNILIKNIIFLKDIISTRNDNLCNLQFFMDVKVYKAYKAEESIFLNSR